MSRDIDENQKRIPLVGHLYECASPLRYSYDEYIGINYDSRTGHIVGYIHMNWQIYIQWQQCNELQVPIST